MHAAVTIAKVQAGKLDEAVKIWQDLSLEIENIQGAKGAYLFTDHNTGKGIGIVLYETEADAKATATSGRFQEMISLFAGVLDGQAVREIYEVTVQGWTWQRWWDR